MKYFLLLCSILLTITLVTDFILITDNLYYDFYSSQLDTVMLSELINKGKKWKWWLYFLLPIFLLIKIFLVSICFSIGFIANGLPSEFKNIINVPIRSEFILLIPSIIKLYWFSFVDTNFDLQDLQYFAPLSLLSLFDPETIETWLIYPLQLMNVFELAYFAMLAWLLRDNLTRDFKGSLGFVVGTYGVGLLIWVIFIMFLSVTFA